MTWRWPISSNGLTSLSRTLLAFAIALPAFAGNLGGQVELTNSRDPAVRHHNYSGVVLWLSRWGNRRPRPRSAASK